MKRILLLMFVLVLLVGCTEVVEEVDEKTEIPESDERPEINEEDILTSIIRMDGLSGRDYSWFYVLNDGNVFDIEQNWLDGEMYLTVDSHQLSFEELDSLEDYLINSAFFDLEETDPRDEIVIVDGGSVRTFVRLEKEGEYVCSWRCDERYDPINERIRSSLSE